MKDTGVLDLTSALYLAQSPIVPRSMPYSRCLRKKFQDADDRGSGYKIGLLFLLSSPLATGEAHRYYVSYTYRSVRVVSSALYLFASTAYSTARTRAATRPIENGQSAER